MKKLCTVILTLSMLSGCSNKEESAHTLDWIVIHKARRIERAFDNCVANGVDEQACLISIYNHWLR